MAPLVSILQTSRTHSTNTASVSAAQEVFDLPELLHEILLRIPASSYRKLGFSVAVTAPAKHLFVLQRVNSTFQAAISGSKNLQRRMGLLSWPEGTEGISACDNADWFLGVIGVLHNGAEVSGTLDHLVASNDLNYILRMPKVDKQRTAQVQYPQASWRKIKGHCVDGGTTLDAAVRRWGYLKLRGIDPKQNMTLGQLHDALQWLIPFMLAYEAAVLSMYDLSPDTTGERRTRMNETRERLQEESAREDIWG